MYKTYAKNINRKKGCDMSRTIEQQFVKNQRKVQGNIDGINAKLKQLKKLLSEAVNENDKKWIKDRILFLNESLEDICKKRK